MNFQLFTAVYYLCGPCYYIVVLENRIIKQNVEVFKVVVKSYYKCFNAVAGLGVNARKSVYFGLAVDYFKGFILRFCNAASV